MLTLERVRTDLSGLPLLTRVGLVVLVLGGFADVVAHLEASIHVGHLHEHTSAEITAHLVAFMGMVLVLLGVVVDGVRRTRLDRKSESTSKGVA